MTENKQESDVVKNGNKMANGALASSTKSSSKDGLNAWSTPGSAAFDFRSTTPPSPQRFPTHLAFLPLFPNVLLPELRH